MGHISAMESSMQSDLNGTYFLQYDDVQSAWDSGFTGKGSIVAVLDTGIDINHPLLQGKVVKNVNFSNDNNYIDLNGHGTHTAGVVVQTAKDCLLYNVKVMDANGDGDFSSVMSGIEWSISNNADVMVLSLGGYYPECLDSHPLSKLISIASSRGIVLCVAVGNFGPASNRIAFPASARDSVAVGAVDKEGYLAGFSSRGPDPCGRTRPDCVAPGVQIVSAYPPSTYMSMDGTSEASPQAAGMFAILKQRFKKGFTKSDTEYILSNSCININGNLKDNSYGWGQIDIGKAINLNPSMIKGVSQSNAISSLLSIGLGATLLVL